MFQGDHSYINTQKSALLAAIGKELLRAMGDPLTRMTLL